MHPTPTARHLTGICRNAAVLVFGWVILVIPVRAEDLTFDLLFPGRIEGRLGLDVVTGPGTYEVIARLGSDPPLGALAPLSLAAAASGRDTDRGLLPERFSAIADTGRRRSDTAITFNAGLPSVQRDLPAQPPAPGDVNPNLIGGAIDPVTALFIILRDQPIAGACRLKAYLYDGRRLSQVVLFQPRIEDGEVTCRGEYRRLRGFSSAEMVERQRFAFSLIYRAAGPGMVHLAEGRGETLYGPARLKRR
jgi:hypothetical protein